jgi:subfamily B ATP-binding cassette protein MsbA
VFFVKNNSNVTNILKRIIVDYVKPYKGKLYLAVFFMVIVAVCAAALVTQVKPIIDEVFIKRDQSMMITIPLIVLAIYSIKGIAEYFQSYIVKYVGQQILTNLQVELYRHLLLADLSFVHAQSSGRLISRFTNDIILMRGAVSNLLVGCVKYFLSVTLLILLMFKLEPVLSFFIFFAFPLAIYPIQKIGRNMRLVIGKAQEELGNYTARLDETFYSIKVIKSFAGEEIEANRSKNIITKILEHYKSAAKLDALTSPIMEILSGLAIACILWYGGYMVIQDKITAGALFAFMTAFVSAYRDRKSTRLNSSHHQVSRMPSSA